MLHALSSVLIKFHLPLNLFYEKDSFKNVTANQFSLVFILFG